MKFFFLALLISTATYAYDLKDKTQLHGVLWAKFTQRLDTDKTPKSGFDIYRGFLIVDNQFNEKWNSQIIEICGRPVQPLIP